MVEQGEETRRLAKVIEHPIRAKIIEVLGEKGPLGWKELSQEIGVRTGALYHHLDTLEGLVERDTAKKYALTKSGHIVYERTSLAKSVDSVKAAALEIQRQGQGRRVAASIFLPRGLLSSLTRTSTLSALSLVVAAAASVAIVIALGLTATLYYFRPYPGTTMQALGLLASLAALTAACYLAANLAFKSKVDVLALAAVVSVSFLPSLAFSSASLFPPLSALVASSNVLFTLFEVFFQTWSSTILGAGLSVASGVRIEKTLLVSLVFVYATMFVMLVRG